MIVIVLKPRLLILPWLVAVIVGHAFANDSFEVKGMVVIPIDVVEVPASRSGLIWSIETKEGDQVQKGQLLGALDDRHAKLQIQLAQTEVRIAEQASRSKAKTESAEMVLAGEKQSAKRLEILREMAARKAENELRVLATRKSEAAAFNEFRRAAESRRQYVESVSTSELESLKLALEKSQLETKQAAFERSIAKLEVQAETEQAKRQQLLIQQAQSEVNSTVSDSVIAELQLQNRQTQLELAAKVLDDHRLISPNQGRVTKIFKKPGSWIKEGDPVVRIVTLHRLRVEGFAPIANLDSFQSTAAVELQIEIGHRLVQRQGQVVFVDPEVDPVNGEFRFWIDFDNEDMVVLPGMRATARILP